MPEHHSSRRTRALKQDIARQQKRRDKLKASGVPTTHVLNRAIAEGFLYWLDAERANGVHVGNASVPVQRVLVYAVEVLSRGTNGTDRYDANAVANALRTRIGKKSLTKFRLCPTWQEADVDDDG